MTGVYSPAGSIAITSVVGDTWTGLHASDGSINVVFDDTTYHGLYHPCGALRVNSSDGHTITDSSGAYYLNTIFGSLGGGASVPTDPITIFAANPALNKDDTNTNTTFFVVTTLNSEDPLDQIRVTLAPATVNTLTVLGVGFAKVVDVSTALGPITEATFNTATGFASATTEQVSDWIDISSLGLAPGDQLAISFTSGGAGQASTRYNDFAYVVDTYFEAGTSWSDPTTTLSGLTKAAGINFAVSKIETRGLSGGSAAVTENTIPLRWADPMFSAMTEYTNNVSLASGADLARLSIVNQSGTQAITCNADNEVSYCRVDTRECIRVLSTAVINKCYLEATGLVAEDDHADTIQVYSPATRDGAVTVTNSHIVAHSEAATAGLFCADDWGGSISLTDVIFQGGPYGLRVNSDPGCHIDISLSNVYFVGPFGAGTYLFQDVGTGTHKVSTWSNVYEATIENNVLVPGAAISAPSFTPRQLDPTLWLEPARGGLFQSNAGTTASSANNDVVGYITDLSGNAKHYTSEADNTTRPTLQGVGTKPCLRFDGVNDLLRRTQSLGLLAGGAYTLAFAFKSSTPAVDARFFTEGNSASNNTLFIPLQAHNPTATTSSALYRNDAGTQLVSPSSMTNTDVFNNADKVFILTDDGAFIRSYVNGVTGTSTGWTPSGVFTLDRSTIGALLRAASGNWWAGDFYGMVAIPRVLTSLERASLTTYMGNLAGLSL